MFGKIRQLVLHTCKEIFNNEEFRKQTIKMVYDFYQSAENRTADIVPSISVMLSQLYTFMQLDNYAEYLKEIPDFTLTREQL